jgi:DNA-binding transcriptional LysR family regulator
MCDMGNFRLKVFRSVAKHLNFRRAAEELCLTQPAVTLQIKALEQEVGAQLFDRSGAHITLTPAGVTLLKYAGRIEKLEVEAQAALTPYSEGERGELRIGASLTIAQYILPHLLGAFQQQHTQVQRHATQSKCWKRWLRTEWPWGLSKAPHCAGTFGPRSFWKMKSS